MKKIFIILSLFITTMSCKAQITQLEKIIPVENQIMYRDNDIEVPDGTYFKDSNNLLEKYVGTYIGSSINLNYKFIVKKITVSFLGIKVDKLIIKYKITDSNGATIIDITNLPDDNPLVIIGNYLDKNGKTYHLDYMGEDFSCGQNGYVLIAIVNDDSQMNLAYSVKGETFDCQSDFTQQLLPSFITLKKL